MFTGIVTAQGAVKAVDQSGEQLRITIDSPYSDLEPGESVAVDGVCLTVVDIADGGFKVETVSTTRGRTRFHATKVGDIVNLERALAVGDRLGGHFVSGHVDGVAAVVATKQQGDALLVDIRVPQAVADVTIPVGSITVDGVSLTVNALPGPNTVQVSLIPYTRDHTTLGRLHVGDEVHVEADMLGKYVSQLLRSRVVEGSRRDNDV